MSGEPSIHKKREETMTYRCAECKGKGFCGRIPCPVKARFKAQMDVRTSSSYMGEAPSVFIGSSGYPKVLSGPLMINSPDDPEEWVSRNLTMDDIVATRSQTIRGIEKTPFISSFNEKLQEIALSSRTLDIEASFEKPVTVEICFDGTIAPVGLSGRLSSMDVIGNASVERAVDKAASDTDLPAAEAGIYLHQSDISVHRITQLLSTGMLGKKRRMVPTKWSITAVDDMISSTLRKRISGYTELSSIEGFHATIHGNTIAVLLLPGPYSFEMIEIWKTGSLWSKEHDCIISDREGLKKSGYSPLQGAYYSARLAACEYMDRVRRCGRILVIRQISGDYWAPLGTWVIREATRMSFSNRPLRFDTLDEGISAVSRVIGSNQWIQHSRIIEDVKTQRTLFDFN